MEHMNEQDIIRLKELLRRTGEFIAYFELVETKMIEWRQDIEQKAENHQRQLHSLNKELTSLRELFTQTGLAQFRLSADETLKQGKIYLDAIQQAESKRLQQLADYNLKLTQQGDELNQMITQHTIQALQKIEQQLAGFSAQHFFRIANESCEQIEKSAQQAVVKSRKLLAMFHWRTAALAFFTSLLTAFIIGLYINDEFPWETHQQVMNERNAGKMLMNAWPKLSYQEKNKILKSVDNSA